MFNKPDMKDVVEKAQESDVRADISFTVNSPAEATNAISKEVCGSVRALIDWSLSGRNRVPYGSRMSISLISAIKGG